MSRQFLSGADYVDALPSGEYVARMRRVKMLTHLGELAFPPGEADGPLFVRCSNVGGFHFAGQASATTNPACYEWRQGSGWKPYGPPCVGVSPVIYDRLGILHTSDGSIGSQGYRACVNDGTSTGKLLTGDETYGPAFGLNEWTPLSNGWHVGQAADGVGLPEGVILWDGSQHRVIEQGNCRFIRASDDGTRVALAYVRPDGAVVYRSTFAELAALPVYTPSTPQPPPVQPPPPQEPPSMRYDVPNAVGKLGDVKARLITAGVDLSGPCGALKILKQFAYENRAFNSGLLKKPSGNNCDGYSVDWIVFPDGSGSDTLSDAGGANGPQWSLEVPNADLAARYVAVTTDPGYLSGIPNSGATVPDPGTSTPPPPVQPPVDLQPLKDQIAALEARISALEQKPAPDAYAKKGDVVDVSVQGSVSLTDALYGRKLTWAGKGVIK